MNSQPDFKYKDIGGVTYEVWTKPLTLRDAIAVDSAQVKLAEEKPYEDIQLVAFASLPLLRHATTRFRIVRDEDTTLDVVGTEITDDMYLSLEETFITKWTLAVLEKNPQRTLGDYAYLKKSLTQIEAMMSDYASSIMSEPLPSITDESSGALSKANETNSD